MAGESSTQYTEARDKPSPPSADTARPETEEQNPFIAFRRYADEQISSMLQSVMGIPSMMTPPHTGRWPYFDEETQQRLRRNESAEQNGDEDRSTDRWSRGHWGSGYDGDFFGSWGFPRHPFNSFESFFDERSPFGFGGVFSPESAFFDGDSQTWPISYLLLSPYSPLHLERTHGRNRRHQGILSFFSPYETTELDPSQPRWRDAFEDLLRVENGQALLDQSTGPDRSRQSANEWLRGLVQRGSIGSNWRLAGPDDSRYGLALERSQQYNGINENLRIEPQEDAEQENKTEKIEPETELDLYDRFLNDITTAHEKYSRAFADSPLMRLLEEERKRHLDQQEVPRGMRTEKTQSKDWLEYTANGNRELLDSQYMGNKSSAEPNVVSTMTKTVRRTQPDGSISTKTIQTRRFADGREESNESEEVIPPPAQKKEKQQISLDEEKGDNNSTGGWFWTR
ncbi:hypothetical protein PISL3812_04376 [Talaromyces islandicus]|uniref:Uncharacterized protein n=1 Tax=Talaromyces islandicus TaxID=28573 RepID=A0A0U1LVG0_TALIS|nr:hypothetical protein PISL3812_04376 [Talaromyces islandicus]